MNTKKKNLLLIEDEVVDQMAFTRFANKKDFSYDFDIAASVQEAIESLKLKKYDVIVSDYFLGDGTAFDILENYKDIPIVITTGTGDEEIAVKAMKLGAYDYLIKDINGYYLRMLPVTVENAINRFKAENELKIYHENLEKLVDERTAELRLERDKLTTIFETMHDGVYIVSKDHDIEYVNKVLIQDFGLPEGKKCYSYFHGGDKPCTFCKNEDVFAGKTVQWEWTSPISGKTYDLIDSPMKNYDGSISKLEIFRDITERKKVEKELLKLSTAVTQSPSVIVVTDLKGNIEYVNPKFTELTGYTGDESIGQSSSLLKSGEQPSEMYKELWETISSGKEWRGEFHNKKKNGELFWEAASISPIINKLGEIINYLKVAEDVTEQKKAELELRQSEQRFKSLFEDLGDAVFVTKVGGLNVGQILEVNYAATLQTGYSKDELLQMNITSDLSVSGSGDISKNDWDELLQLGKTVTTTEKKRKKDGTEFWTEVIVTPIEFNGEKASLSISHDIAERMQAEIDLKVALEKSTESDRLKSAFLTNLSHEIRTPMNGILGFVGLLKQPGLSGNQQQEFIKIIETSSDRMLATVDDLVNISMIESGQVKVSLSEVNVNEQTEDIHRLLNLEAEKKGLQLLLKNSLPTHKANIKTDSSKIYTILTNIVKNAIKFSLKGSVEFGYNVVGNTLEFFVKDTGIGIQKDRQEAIFERFVKADIEDKAVFEGSGLGLTIAKAYVEMLDGSMWLESEEGIGSTFYFTIPFNPVKNALAKNKVGKSDTSLGISLKKRTILIVEDEDSSAAFLNTILSRTEATLLNAKTGVEAIEVMRNNPSIDIILMDLKMPVISGYEATQQIRIFNKDVIIIAQTAYALKGDREKAIEVGCDDYITKPINRKMILEMIENMLALQRE